MSSQKYSKLAGKHVLVIGGTSGIGYSVAEASLTSGAVVTISSSNPEKVALKVSALQSTYPSSIITGHVCDLSLSPATPNSTESAILSLLQSVSKPIDHIVFTAGDALSHIPVSEITLDKMYAAGHIRFFAPLLLAKYAKEFLNEGPGSSIVLTTGSVAEKPWEGRAVVAGFGAGIHGMVRNLALDLKPIRVNAVSPGVVLTELWDFLPAATREDILNETARDSPTGRVGQPEDVAEAYLWLMKDSNATGVVASSDSGRKLV
ncbi:hypothetical protein BJ875DRAFT_409460 [Amylocarpus encephaloides]|uniref:Short chain dehydrogenase n=1 Tax=Amylocarpus encephaloides TaxID=45428 RepID=A0A9P7YAH2_9HELO|nr:hypothetical protein BJ875DRAFT_409460 [Amylocarpus encephaloides]